MKRITFHRCPICNSAKPTWYLRDGDSPRVWRSPYYGRYRGFLEVPIIDSEWEVAYSIPMDVLERYRNDGVSDDEARASRRRFGITRYTEDCLIPYSCKCGAITVWDYSSPDEESGKFDPRTLQCMSVDWNEKVEIVKSIIETMRKWRNEE